MVRRGVITLMLMSLILISFVTAHETQTVEEHSAQGTAYFTDGYTLNVLHPEHVKLNTNITIYASFYDKNGKLQNNNTAVCLLGILSPKLDRVVIYEDINRTFLNGDTILVTQINGDFFTEIGEYYFNYNCDATVGGYFQGAFTVTQTGSTFEHTELLLGTLLVLAFLMVLLFHAFKENHWILRTFFLFIASGLGLTAMNLARLVAGSTSESLTLGMTGLVIMVVVNSILLIYMFVYAFIEIIKVIKEKEGLRWKY